ncbi:fatty acid/sphingolipid desaturase [Cantharellus anzutake]|uniref:fatty acid/sphingolipid desaturase n=1 Tax=Cantharellus anzutake TaxID=1750568 RepID=UPI001904DE95|nr:fatty acid/sphingolipid desaturase [Cantharellus anzutake]KAF8326829.1 fatty acid/sphingolipid desaturase [Cantharellus anzutake]
MLAILHYVGRDATDEIEAYHDETTLRRVIGFAVGRVEIGDTGWEPFIPPVQTGWVRRQVDSNPHNHSRSEILLVKKQPKCGDNGNACGPGLSTITPPPSSLSLIEQTQHARAYRELHRGILKAGLYQTPYLAGYGPEFARYFSLALLSCFFYSRGWFVCSALFLGLLWHQLTFIAHDLGHMGVTHNWVLDRLAGIIIAGCCGGLSIGWWVDNHNIHHLVTNHPTHDPDIQHIPFFAISPAFFRSLYSSYYERIMSIDAVSRFLLPIQHRLYYIVLSLARFNLYANSYWFLWKQGFKLHKRLWTWWAEIAAIVSYWTWYCAAVKGCGHWKSGLAFVLVSHVVASPVHVQIVLSHFSRSTADLGPTESFVDRQLRTTSDVICSPSVEFIHGGLHLQVTHHLFPRLPRHNLRQASIMVKEFAKEQGLDYAEFKWVEGNREVLGVLESVAEQAKIFSIVAKSEVQSKMNGGVLKVDSIDDRVHPDPSVG